MSDPRVCWPGGSFGSKGAREDTRATLFAPRLHGCLGVSVMRRAAWVAVVILVVVIAIGATEAVRSAANQKHEMTITGTK